MRNAGRQAGRICHRVIAGQASGAVDQRRAADRNGLAIGRVLVVEHGALACNTEGFASDQAVQYATRQAGVGIAVIHLAARYLAAQDQRPGRDIGRAAGAGAGQRIVARIRTAKRDAVDIDGLAFGRILVAKRAAGRGCQAVASQHAAESCSAGVDRRNDIAVVFLVAGLDAGYRGNGRFRDISRGTGRGTRQVVVAGISAAEDDAGDPDFLAGRRVLVDKRAAGRSRQLVVGHHAGKGRASRVQAGSGFAIIFLVASRNARYRRNGCLRDIGLGNRRGAAQLVVAGIDPAERDAGNIDILAGRRILVDERAAGRSRQLVVGHHPGKGRASRVQAGSGFAIIFLVAGCNARYRHILLRDIGLDAGRIADLVIAGQARRGARTGIAQGSSADRHRLVAAGVLVAEHAALAGQGQDFIADQAVQFTARQRCDTAAVIGLVGSCHVRHRQGLLIDIRRQPGRIGERVIAGQAAAIADTDRYGLAVPRILVGKRCCQGQRFTIDHASQGGACQRCRRAAVVGLADRRAADRQFFLRDIGRHASRIADLVVAGQARRGARTGIAQGSSADRHRLVAAGVLVAEHAALAGQGQDFIADQAVQFTARQRCDTAAVIGLVGSCHVRHRQGLLIDIRRQPGRIGERVIAGQAAAIADTDRYGLAVPRILVGKRCCQGQRFTIDHASQGGACQRCRRAAVVGLADRRAADRQLFLRDIGRHAGRIADRVIAGQARAIANDGAADCHHLAIARIFVAEHAALARQCQGFRAHQTTERAARQRCGRAAVVGLVGGGYARHRQCFRRNAGQQTGRTGNRVIAGQPAAVGNGKSGNRHGFAVTHILVTEHARAARQYQRLAADQAGQRAAGQSCRQQAVIHLAARRHARHRQGFRRDIGGKRRIGHRVVAGQAAVVAIDQRGAGRRYGLACACILVIEGRHQARRAQRFRADRAGNRAARDAGLGGAVVDFVDRRHAGDRHRFRRDRAAAAAGGAGQVVVARIRAAQGNAGHRHRFRHAGILVGERGVGRAQRQAVAADHAVEGGAGGADGGLGIGVVDLAVGNDIADSADGGLGDIGRQAGRVGNRVVGRHAAIGAARQARAADGDRFRGADILVSEYARHAGQGQGFLADQAVQAAAADDCHRAAVVDPAGRCRAGDRQGFLGNAGLRAAAGVDRVIAGQAAVAAVDQRAAADCHGLAAARILVGKGARQAGQVDRFRADKSAQGAARDAGGSGTVIYLVGRRQRARYRQRLLRDRTGHAGRIGDRVIAGQTAAVGNGKSGNRHGLAVTHILVAEHARAACQYQRLAADQAGQRAAGQSCRQQAVIHLAARRHARHRQGFRRDIGGKRRIGHRVVAGQAAVVAIDQRGAGRRYGLACACILVIEGRHQARRAQRFRADRAGNRAARDAGLGGAVVDFVDRRHAGDRHRFRRDRAAAAAGGAGQVVVARIRAAQGNAGHRHRFRHAGILVGERGVGRAQRQAVAADHAVEGGAGGADGGLGIGVVDLAVGNDIADSADGGLGDIGRQAGRVGNRVVGRHAAIGAARQARAADGDRFRGADILVSEYARHAGQGQGFLADQAVQAAAADDCHRAAVVDPVDGRRANHRQRFWRDRAGDTGRRGERVVAGQAGAIDQRAGGHRQRLAGAGVNVGEDAGRGAGRHHFAGDQPVQGAAGQRGDGGTVILPGDGGQAGNRQRFRRDVAGDASQRPQRIVGAGAAAQTAAGADGEVIADVLAGISANHGGGVERDVALVGGEHAADAAASERGTGGAVIDFAAGADAGQAELARRNDQAAVDIRDRIAQLRS